MVAFIHNLPTRVGLVRLARRYTRLGAESRPSCSFVWSDRGSECDEDVYFHHNGALKGRGWNATHDKVQLIKKNKVRTCVPFLWPSELLLCGCIPFRITFELN